VNPGAVASGVATETRSTLGSSGGSGCNKQKQLALELSSWWTTSTRTMSLSTARPSARGTAHPPRVLSDPARWSPARTACSARPTRAPWAAFTLGRSPAVRLETDGSCFSGPSYRFLNAFPHPESGIASNIGKDGRAKRVIPRSTAIGPVLWRSWSRGSGRGSSGS